MAKALLICASIQLAEQVATKLMAEILALLLELRNEVQMARADINSLKVKVEASLTPRPKRAIISAPSIDGWSDDNTIALSAEEWARVKRGETITVTTTEDFGGEPIRNHWQFSGGIGGTLKRDVEWAEGDIDTEYEITLVDGNIELIDD